MLSLEKMIMMMTNIFVWIYVEQNIVIQKQYLYTTVEEMFVIL